MATLTTFTAGTVIRAADVNANFVAVNTDIAGAMRTGYTNAVPVGNVLTGVDPLHQWTMPANTIATVGDGLIVHAQFVFANNANTKTVKFNIGTGTAIVLNSTTAPNNKDLLVDLVVVYTSASGFKVYGTPVLCGHVNGSSPTLESSVTGLGLSANPATALTVGFTGEGTASDDVDQSYTLISIFKAS